jgi:hypothetical protein
MLSFGNMDYLTIRFSGFRKCPNRSTIINFIN